MRKSLIMLVSIVVTIALTCVVSFASTYYVNSARSNDSGDGKSWSAAKKTIAAGVALLRAGDTLKIQSGTYNEGILVTSGGSAGSIKIIETDDGSGNPGVVTLTGTVAGGTNANTLYNQIRIEGDYVKIDGRQANGFVCSVASNHYHGILIFEADNCVVQYVKLSGTLKDDSNASLLFGVAANNLEVAYCYFINSQSSFIVQAQDGTIVNIHHNEVTGKASGGSYSPVRLTRCKRGKIYDNYIHDIERGNGGWASYIALRESYNSISESDACEVYNNVLWIQTGSQATAFEIRGSGTCVDGCWYAKIYNNTIIYDGTGELGGILAISQASKYNEFYNNLVIGNVGTFVWTYQVCEPGYHEMYNNSVTGSVGRWFETNALANWFTVKNNNSAGIGTSFINFYGNRPSPYWDLKAIYNGASNNLATDYDGLARSSPPSVGAYDWQTDTQPPNPPTGLKTY